MKTLIITLSLLFATQPSESQILKKVKEAITEKEVQPTVPGEKLSGSDLQFGDWGMGKVEIVAISMFADDYEKYQENVGSIQPDGRFSIDFPEEEKTWQPLSVYKESCIDTENATIDNPNVKFAWYRLYVIKNGKYIGTIQPANPVKAAYNLNSGGVNNGKLGHYYLWVYADGEATVSINCEKKQDITDGKGTTYEDFELTDYFNLKYKKGWNVVEVHNQDNIWVGLTKHYTERSWSVANEIPDNATWVFRPID